MSDDRRTDAELLVAAKQDDGAAFAVLVRRYIRAATLLAVQLLGDNDEAEDIVQEAFSVVHTKARTFDAARPFSPWLFAIVRRLARNRRSRALRRTRLLQWWRLRHVSEQQSAHTEDVFLSRLDAATAVRAVEHLSAMQRACFELVSIRGLSVEEVAMMHGISQATVRQHIFRARAALRKVLGEQ